MSFTLEALGLLVILLPGFLSSTVLDHVVVRKPKDNFGKSIEALVFSFVIYTLATGIAGAPVFEAPSGASDYARVALQVVEQSFVWWSLGIAVALPLGLGLLSSTDALMSVLRRLRITNKSARETAWLDVFTDLRRRYVFVNLSGGRRISGWPLYYSNDRDEGLLYLLDPAWVNDDGTYTVLDIHGIFLVERGSIESIEFTNATDRPSRQRSGGTDEPRELPSPGGPPADGS